MKYKEIKLFHISNETIPAFTFNKLYSGRTLNWLEKTCDKNSTIESCKLII